MGKVNRLTEGPAHIRIKVDEYSRDRRDDFEPFLSQMGQKLRGHLEGTTPDCIGCRNLDVDVQQQREDYGMTTLIQMTAKCKVRMCPHDMPKPVMEVRSPFPLREAGEPVKPKEPEVPRNKDVPLTSDAAFW